MSREGPKGIGPREKLNELLVTDHSADDSSLLDSVCFAQSYGSGLWPVVVVELLQIMLIERPGSATTLTHCCREGFFPAHSASGMSLVGNPFWGTFPYVSILLLAPFKNLFPLNHNSNGISINITQHRSHSLSLHSCVQLG